MRDDLAAHLKAHATDAPRVITNVYHWANGMTMVFDQFGEQMPEYQGRTDEVREKIDRDRPASSSVTSNAHWRNA